MKPLLTLALAFVALSVFPSPGAAQEERGPLVPQATASGVPPTPLQQNSQPNSLPQVKTVSRTEYLKAVNEFERAIVAAEAARQQLASRQPARGKPDSIDCSFHPWHLGCKDIFLPWSGDGDSLFRTAIQQRLESPLPIADAQKGLPVAMWGVLFYAIKFTACLVEADGGHDGLEGPDGLKKVGKCVVSSLLLVESGKWTPWLNRDSPSGVGDFETLPDFTKSGEACPSPRSIECQTTDGLAWQEAGQVYSCTTTEGGVCRNADQPRGSSCRDYRVRFLCP